MSNQRLWGLTLLERNLGELAKLGIEEIVILVEPKHEPQKYFSNPSSESLSLTFNAVNPADPFDSLRKKLARTNSNVLVLEGNALNDRRILIQLINSKSPCGVISPNGLNKAGAAILSSSHATFFGKEAGNKLTLALETNIQRSHIPKLDLRNFNSYMKNLRRDILPFLILVENSEHLEIADDFLKQTVHKGTNDFVAKYIHPPLEFSLTRILADTRITPNQVTFIGIFLSALTVYLFATGNLLLGIILAAIKGVLDGVDGKLARLLLRFSKSGELLDHVGDTIFDALWYLAWGWYFSKGDFFSVAGTFTVILFVSYCVERIVPGIFKKLHGSEIYDYKEIDRFMRLVGSRMNNNVWVMMIGIIVGLAKETFYFISLWMLATACWHTFRLLYVTWNSRINKAVLNG